MFLYPYQYDAVKSMHNGCILNGGVGSGKSRTSLYYFWSKNGGDMDPYREPSVNQQLVIITTAMKRDTHEWEHELSLFGEGKIDAIIDSWNNIKKYTDIKGAFFIFDEQRVVGYGAWTKAFLKIAKANEWILLSATPGDTWSDYIPVFVANGFYKNKTDFSNQHIIWNHQCTFPKIDRYVDTGILLRQRESLLVDMNFKRPTVAHHIDVECSYDKAQYKTAMKERWDPFKNEPIAQASGLCYVLRKIVNSDDSRIEATINLLREKKRAIIFYNFNYELEALRNALNDLGYAYSEWNGQCHEKIPNGDEWAYLVQYSAGAEGWNSTETDTIIFYSLNYSYKIMAQAAGRIDRLNTPYTDLYYYHLKSFASIDIAIAKAIDNKRIFNAMRWVPW